MNKKTRIIIDLILIILGIIFLVFGIKDTIEYAKSQKQEDAIIFKKDYSYVPKDNVYKYITLKEADKMLSKNSGMLLIGNPEDSWTQVLVNPLNEIAMSKNTTIYYLENKNLDKNSKHYQNILSSIDLEELSNPTIIIIKKGKVQNLYLKDDLYKQDFDGAPIEYWTEELKQDLKKNISNDIDSLN